ncbi:metal ABC transporter permease [Zavarzinia compransoris]|uniref:Zinc ABC transporter permease n=1 Tax=Zavarzinia compransoris TaxID=1264899 RepID=A0A317E9M3_9PROT|nr:metal ABC transporter permease [Zavarzinia compransoris]PWR23262.1 zinc ABC transporter permease [Zavarzinia compransoris]TDP46172.1 zinc/manganese transport system permease protein [Zavarzinia compransoris]
MDLWSLLFEPFAEFTFMRRALVACFALALGCGPVGVLLMLRRMSLIGDAMSHAVLPGAAIGFLIAGLNIWAMGLGGLIAGLSVALLSGLVTRMTALREDASFAGFYLISLSLGVLIVSTRGSNVDLLHVLFGTILAVDDASLLTVAAIATLSLAVLAVIYRPLIVECFDPGFLRAVGGGGSVYHVLFLVLVVVNLVAGFQALGTLMAVGLMMLPAAASRFWAGQVWSMSAVAIVIAMLSGWLGLLVSYHTDLPSGPAIVITAGVFYAVSIIAGPVGGIVHRFIPRRHLEA